MKCIDEALAGLLLDLVRLANEITAKVDRAGLVAVRAFAGHKAVAESLSFYT